MKKIAKPPAEFVDDLTRRPGILFVDGDARLRNIAAKALTGLGKVQTASEGFKALEAVAEHRPDVVLVEATTVGLTDLLSCLRSAAMTATLSVILMTKRGASGANIAPGDIDEYLRKPFTEKELVARVRTQLELRRLAAVSEAASTRMYELFMQAPMAISLISGKARIFELANPRLLEMVGRTALVGKSLLGSFPELPADAPIIKTIEDIFVTGKPFTTNEYRVPLLRGGVLQDVYFQFTSQPVLDDQNNVTDVLSVAVEVTEQVLARRRAEQSEQRFRQLVAQVQAGIIQTDLLGRFTLVNHRFRQISGRSKEELLGLRIKDITHPQEVAEVLAHFARVVEDGVPFVMEMRLVHPDGTSVWVRSRVSRIDDHDGRPQGIAGVIMDITQQRQNDQALRESEARFRNMADHAPVMVWVTDRDGRCTFLSQTWYDFTGQTPATGLGFGWLDAVHPDDRENSSRVFIAANRKQAPFRLEYRLRRKDGQYRWAIDSAHPRREHGEFLGYIGSAIDITERKDLELRLRESEQRYRGIFENMEVPLWDLDCSAVRRLVDELRRRHGGDLGSFLAGNPAVAESIVASIKVRNVNPAAVRLLKADNKDHVMAALSTLFLPETKRAMGLLVLAIAEHRPSFQRETIIKTFTGEIIDVEATIRFPVPLPAAGAENGEHDVLPEATVPLDVRHNRGAWRQVLATIIDVSSRKVIEREREARVAEMERAVRFSEVFAGVLGHDLRNPLSAIATAASMLERRASSAKIALPVARISTSAERMDRMIKQLLDFTRIRLGSGIPVNPSRADLESIARSTIEELEPVFKRKIDLEINGDGIGVWDTDRLCQLFSNLTANACQHGTAGTPVCIRIDGSLPSFVRIEIKNRGIIPPEMLSVLFEPLHSTSESACEKRLGTSGLGLGLFITEQIALAHRGTIEASSSKVAGTTFSVTLPRHCARNAHNVFDAAPLARPDR